MILPSDQRYTPDISETGCLEQLRRMWGLPPELGLQFWEAFLADLQESPELRSAVRVTLAELGGDDD